VSKLSRHVDDKRILRAIEEAEKRTTGEIRVSLAPHFWGSVRKAADRAFVRLRMTQTPERNGVLVFVVPSRREFAIVGDRGIHERVGHEFWERVSAAMSERIHAADLTDGILHAVSEAGKALAEHFPRRGGPKTGGLTNAVDE
jgi:uncharacterized membrane protein